MQRSINIFTSAAQIMSRSSRKPTIPTSTKPCTLWDTNEYGRTVLNAQERALMGGMRGAGFSALLGLDRISERTLLQRRSMYIIYSRKYPRAELSISAAQDYALSSIMTRSIRTDVHGKHSFARFSAHTEFSCRLQA